MASTPDNSIAKEPSLAKRLSPLELAGLSFVAGILAIVFKDTPNLATALLVTSSGAMLGAAVVVLNRTIRG